MPNWTTNNLMAEGIEKMPLFDDGGRFDFNKIVPMPENVRDTICGSIEKPAILCYLTDKFAVGYDDISPEDLDKIESYIHIGTLPARGMSRGEWEALEEGAEKWLTDLNALYEEGRRYVDNVDRYGYPDWYEWAYAYWGVKWNACETFVTEGCVSFETPWGPPDEAVKALSAQHPNTEFILEYQNEDEPFTIRTMRFVNGRLTHEDEYTDEDALSELESEMEETVKGCCEKKNEGVLYEQ